MTTNLHDKMLAAIDAYFSASDAVEEEVAENLLLDVRDEINKHKLAEQPAQTEAERLADELEMWTPAELRRLVSFNKDLMDEVARLQKVEDADRAYELLRRAETEMRYAGWNRLLTDNYARKDIYDDIKEFLK